MKRTISIALRTAGVLLMLGSAGDSDTNVLTFEGVLLKVAVATTLFAVGYILSKKVNTPKPKPESVTLNNEFVNCKQATTPAYKNNFTTTKGNCQL